jgi:5-dehydro-2-deoxygluconokinase
VTVANDDRPIDVICVGRVAVDLYSQQSGARLEDMQSFSKSLGGSSGNVAFGTARLGLKSSMVSRVGDEHMGRFLREELAREGVDISHLHTDPDRMTGLVVLGTRGDGTFPHIFFRTDCADMATSAEDFDEVYIALSKAVAVTGTHLSRDPSRAACVEAVRAARQSNTRTILDIDYRPVLWGLTSPGAGESRFVPSPDVTEHLQKVMSWFDVVVGTEEEFHIAGGSTDIEVALRAVRKQTDALLVLKLGARGCAFFEGPIPDDLTQGVLCPPFVVPVTNTLGAGDAFMSGFLRGYLRGEALPVCGMWGNACGALVVNWPLCAPAMPSFPELQTFLAKAANGPVDPSRDPDLRYLHRVAERKQKWNNVAILAFDHRSQMEEVCSDPERIRYAKEQIARGAAAGARGSGLAAPHVIVDDRYGAHVLATLTGAGGFIARPIELPGSRPVAFEGGGDVTHTLSRWPREHVVKCLVHYSTEDPDSLRAAQEARVRALWDACMSTEHELMLEVITPSDAAWGDWGMEGALERFYALGVRPDWWKLAAPSDASAWAKIEEAVQRNDPYCRGVLVLGLDATAEDLERSIVAAAHAPICRGFAIGRTIWRAPFERWLADGDDASFQRDVAAGYARFVDVWRQARSTV